MRELPSGSPRSPKSTRSHFQSSQVPCRKLNTTQTENLRRNNFLLSFRSFEDETKFAFFLKWLAKGEKSFRSLIAFPEREGKNGTTVNF